MSTTIDERVVEMRFDNKDFESNVKTSMSTLEKLERSLDLRGASKGLDNVGTAAKRLDFSGLSSAVETVHAKFSALEVIAVTALANITNSAVNAGKRIVSALTIDPIKTGFAEYETQINAVQTILANTASKGTTINDVNKALDELNTYADKTIYNFTQMTRNIGTFTAAGIDLKTSTSAIQGIANLAAVSGSTSQQASTAMYQLSQALSAGTLKLQDWNSVVNAGMGGQVFQDSLKETSRQMVEIAKKINKMSAAEKKAYQELNGYTDEQMESMSKYSFNVDKIIEKQGSFRNSLQEGWITADVLTMTLRKMTKSGVIEYISEMTGMTEESIKELQSLGDTLGYDSEQAKDLALSLAEGDDARAKLIIDTIKMASTAEDAATKVKTFTQLWDTLKESAQSGWTQSWEIVIGDFEEAKVLLTEVSDVLGAMIGASAEARNAVLQGWKDLGGRTALIESVRNAFNGVLSIVKPIKEAFKEIFPSITAQQLYNISKSIKDLSEKFKIGGAAATNLKNTFKGLFAVIDLAKQAVTPFLGLIKPIAGALLTVADGILKITGPLGEYLVALNDTAKKTQFFNNVFKDFTKFVTDIGKGVKTVIDGVVESFNKFAKVDSDSIDALGERIVIRFEPLSELLGLVGKAFGGIAKVFTTVAPFILKFATMMGSAFGMLAEYISETIGNLEFDDFMDFINTILFGNILVGIKKFVKSLTELTENGPGFIGFIKDLFGGLKDTLRAFQADLKSGVLLKIASAVALLAASLIALSLVDSNKLTSGITAISLLFMELFAAMTGLGEMINNKSIRQLSRVASVMTTMSISVAILAGAMTILSKLDWEGVFKGLIGVAGLATILVISAQQLSTSGKKLIKGSTGLIGFAAAILVLTEAVKRLSELEPERLAQGLIGIGVLLVELGLFMEMTDFKKIGVSNAVGILIFAAAMNVFAKAVDAFGSINTEVLGKGLLALAGALAIVTAAVNYMPKNMVSIGVGMVAISGALVIMAKALGIMGGMTLEQIGASLIGLGAALVIIATAVNSMSGALAGAAAMLVISAALRVFVPALQSLGSTPLNELGIGLLSLFGVFAILGGAAVLLGPLTPVILGLSAAIALFGVGCVAVGAGILAFSAGLAALAVSGTAGAAALVTIITAIIGLIPMIMVQIGNGIISIAKIIAEGATVIASSIVTVLMAIIDSITTTIPAVVSAIGVLLDTMLTALVTYIPKLVTAGMQLLLGVLTGINDNIAYVVVLAMSIVGNFLTGVASQMPYVIQSGVNVIVSFITGLADAISSNTPIMVESITKLFHAIMFAAKETVVSFASDFLSAGASIIEGLINGIKSAAGRVVEAAKGVVQSALDGAKKLLGINSPSKAFAEIGRWSDEGLIVGLKTYSNKVTNAAKDVGEGALDGMSDAFSNVSNIISSDMNLDPTIRPVIDLSNIQSGVKILNAMFSREQALGISASMSKAKTGDSEIQNGVNGAASGGTVNFTQINNSPKALNRVEIYRQTKNQISSMKELVNAK